MQPLRPLLMLSLALAMAAQALAGPTPQMAPPALAQPEGAPQQAVETLTLMREAAETPVGAAGPAPLSVPMAPGEVLVEGTIDAVANDRSWVQVSVLRAAGPEGAETRLEAPLAGTLLLGVTRRSVMVVGPAGERLGPDALRPGAPFAAAVGWPVSPAPAILPVRRIAVGLPEAAPEAGAGLPGPAEPDRTCKAPITLPMLFPVVGRVSWSDTFLASRGGGTRWHRGQDLVAPKMTPVVAAFDGTVYPRGGPAHYLLTLVGDDGWSAEYMHLNNDTPGTDDGKGGEAYAFAPGIRPGVRVVAGQLLGWVGDSGNAEGTVPHLHFELVHRPTGTPVNAAPSLRLARQIAAPRVPEVLAEVEPSPGEARWNGFVRVCSPERGTVYADISARAEGAGKMTVLTRPQQCTIRFGPEATLAPLGARDTRLSLADVAPGSLLVVVGRKVGGEIAARAAFAEATGLVPGSPLLAALAALAPAAPAVVAAAAAPSVPAVSTAPAAAAPAKTPPAATATTPPAVPAKLPPATPVKAPSAVPEDELLWVHGHVLMAPFQGSVMIRMGTVRLPGSGETIKLPRALLKEVILGAGTRLRDANGRPITPEALVTDAEVEVLGDEEGKTAPLYAATLTLRSVPGK